MGSNWQPIDTAPKNTWVYVITKGADVGGISLLGDFWINTELEPDPYAERATHWMPLPEAPTQQEVDNGK